MVITIKRIRKQKYTGKFTKSILIYLTILFPIIGFIITLGKNND